MNINSSYNPFLSAFLQLITPEAWAWYGHHLKLFVFFVASLIDKLFQLILRIFRYKTMQTFYSKNFLQQDKKLEFSMCEKIIREDNSVPHGWDVVESNYTNNAETEQSVDSHLECTHVDEEIACPSLAAHDTSELEEEFPDTWG